jgi:predicted nuclease with TOPRIM domain
VTPRVRAGAGGGELNDRMDAEPEDAARWLEEGRRFLGRWREALDALIAENERLRADSERLAALAIENTRLREETARFQAEREELLAAFSRMADLVEQVRRSRGGGEAG